MHLFVNLTSPESKRLIGKAAAAMPLVREVQKNGGRILISPGSTTGYVLEELSGEKIDLARFPCGTVAHGRTCRTPEDRLDTVIWENGCFHVPEPLGRDSAAKAAASLGRNDLLIKGANAIDREGNAGFLLGNPYGGLILAFAQAHAVRKCPILIPVGLEKLIASVPAADRAIQGRDGYARSFGRPCGYFTLDDGIILTELEAIEILSGCRAVQVAAGGLGESAGSVTLSAEGSEAQIEQLYRILKSIKGEPPVPEWKMLCRDCEKHCDYPYKEPSKTDCEGEQA